MEENKQTEYDFHCLCGNDFKTNDYFISYGNYKETKCPICGEEISKP